MIDQVDSALVKWAADVLNGAASASLSAPGNGNSAAVSLYLMEIVNDPLPHGGGMGAYQPALRYLVTTNAADPQEAHRMLAELLYAAMASRLYEVELEPVPAQVWSGFDVAPRPAFILRTSLPQRENRKPAKPVRQPEPATDSGVPVVPLYGLLLGPDDIPIMNARIELPNLFRSAYTDSKGIFVLQGVPAAPKEKTLLIKARKREKTETIRQTGSPAEPVVIRFNLFENEGEN